MALADQFLTAENRVKWRALGAAATGGTVYATFVAWIEGTLSVLSLPSMVVTGILDGTTGQLGRFLSWVRDAADTLWSGQVVDLGLFQLPFNVLLLLVLFSTVAFAVKMWRS
ncbi:hypothetical protein [Halarchaeum sp. P4]|uniref:hypothetical protein n=1 Tax=Halarchaeum sp. P4 TaxID=3421639 RepID=UPI003EB6D1FC